MTDLAKTVEDHVAYILGHGFSNTSFEYLRTLLSPVLIKASEVETAVAHVVTSGEAALLEVETVATKVEAVVAPVVKEAVVLAKPVVTAADARITAAMQGLAADLKKAVEKDKVTK